MLQVFSAQFSTVPDSRTKSIVGNDQVQMKLSVYTGTRLQFERTADSAETDAKSIRSPGLLINHPSTF